MSPANWHDLIETECPRLLALGYRMTGSRASAEDIVQQAWLRSRGTDPNEIAAPSRWLSTVVMRLCLDHLRQDKREAYIGPWLPEPLIASASAEEEWIKSEELGIGLVLMLNSLPPMARAAFLLHEAFDYSHDEIAAALSITPTTSRQMISRARRRMANAKTDLPDTAGARTLAAAFWRASRDGNLTDLMALMAPDVEVLTDGGGKVYAALKPIKGADKAARLFVGLAQKRNTLGSLAPPLQRINGGLGFISHEEDTAQTTAFALTEDGLISAIWICRNPDKLTRLPSVN